MTAVWASLWARQAGLLLAGCYLVHPLIAHGFTAGPTVLILVMTGLLSWYRWGEATLPREALSLDSDLRAHLAALATLAGVDLRAVSVAPGEGELVVPALLSQAGEIVFSDRELATSGGSVLLARAARQLATAAAPAEPAWTVMLVGAALGVLTGLHARFGASAAAGAGLMIGAVAVTVAVAAGTTARAERQHRAAEDRARELLGQLRDQRPAAFADLAVLQGLAGVVQLAGQPQRPCAHSANEPAE